MLKSNFRSNLRSNLKSNLKVLIPASLRRKLHVLKIQLQDLWYSQYTSFVGTQNLLVNYPVQIILTQPIEITSHSESKKHNLHIGIQNLQNRQINPGQILSFWHIVPVPNAKNGYRKGRNITDNALGLDYGGGLCQLSGILYHLALIAGLEIIERHPHSLDLYNEKTRYTPLGSDATVVYGYKDLRIRNNFSFPFCLQFEIQQDSLVAKLCAMQTVSKCKLEFAIEEHPAYKIVRVWRHIDQKILISNDIYRPIS